MNKKSPVNLNTYASQTKIRLVLGFLIILFIVGIGLIWIFFGHNAALFGLLCLFGAGIPISLIALFLLGLDSVIKKQQN